MGATCEFRKPDRLEKCGAPASWIADIGWLKETAAYEGTSWNVALCDSHYEELLAAGRITGTAHRVSVD